MNLARILFRGSNVKRHIGQEVNLVQDQQLGFEENGRVFERFVFSLRDTENYDFRSFAQIIARGADQVADIFDQQQIDVFQRPVGKRSLDHAGIEMASPAGRNLFHGEAEPRQAHGVVFGLDIAGQHGDALVRRKAFERALQQTRLARARRTDQIKA